MKLVHVSVRDGFKTTEEDIFLGIIDDLKLFTFVTKSIVLVVERIQYPSLLSVLLSSNIFKLKTASSEKIKTVAHFSILLVYTYVSRNFGPIAP